MNRTVAEELALSLLLLLSVGIAPNLFPADLAGVAKLSWTGKVILLPSIALFFLIVIVATVRGHTRLTNRAWAGVVAGLVGTLGLEVIRATSFRLGGMPGDMPRLLGVLLTDRFMMGPNLGSDLLGWAYHFWNGVAFAVIFAVIFGRRPLKWSVVYAQLIGLGLLAGPVVKSFGIGPFGSEMPAMPATVVLAHLVFGLLMGRVLQRRLRDGSWLLAPLLDRSPSASGAPARRRASEA